MKYYDVKYETVLNKNTINYIKCPFIVTAGKSNVGKSTFINKLLNRKNIARTGKTPGTTRFINLFIVDNKYQILDLPGYGYAKTSLKKTGFDHNIIDKLFFDNRLIRLLFLIDIRHKPSKKDIEFFNIIYENGLMNKTIICLSKSDKLSKNKRIQQKKMIKDILQDNIVDIKLDIRKSNEIVFEDIV